MFSTPGPSHPHHITQNIVAADLIATSSFQPYPPPNHSSSLMHTVPRTITTYTPFAPCRGERRNYLASTKYPTSVPSRIQISPGVWSDGKDRVLSAAYPPVQLFLKEARSTLKQPLAPTEVILTLAALEVFYKPGDPAHWIFWSDEKKHQTAEVVTRIALHQPPLVRSPVAWNGTSEYLSILANHHGSTYRHVYESQHWYEKFVPPKPSAAPKVLNLRKRKPNPGAFREPSKSPGPEEDEPAEAPPRKRAKSKTAASPEPPTMAHKGSLDVAERPTPSKIQKSSSVSSPDNNSHENASPQPEAPEQETTSIDEVVTQTRVSARNRKTVTPQAISSSSRASSVSPQDNSAGSASTHSRNRSTSYASSQTVVASNSSRRSSSVLSASTTVEGHDSGKGKQPAHDSGEQGAKDNGDAQSDEEGMVTRGRASRARVESSKVVSEIETDRAKSGKQAPIGVRGGVQKAKRKP